jgi:hypothetical protein
VPAPHGNPPCLKLQQPVHIHARLELVILVPQEHVRQAQQHAHLVALVHVCRMGGEIESELETGIQKNRPRSIRTQVS